MPPSPGRWRCEFCRRLRARAARCTARVLLNAVHAARSGPLLADLPNSALLIQMVHFCPGAVGHITIGGGTVSVTRRPH